MINLLVVGLWLTFLICVVGFILYSEINKSKKDLLRVRKADIASLSILLDEKENSLKGYILDDKRRTDVFLSESLGLFREWFEAISKKVAINQELLVNVSEKFADASTPTKKEVIQELESKLKNYKEMYENVSDNLKAAMEKSNQKLVTTTEEVIEEWVQYFPVNREYPTILETWVSSLGTIKQIYEDKIVYTYYSPNFKSVCFDHLRLHLLIAKCFLTPKNETDMSLVIDKEKPITKNNVIYVDRSEMQFIERESFGVSKIREDYFLVYYRQNNLGYHSTIEEAQKVVYNYRKQWLIDNDRVEWLDLWKPNFVE